MIGFPNTFWGGVKFLALAHWENIKGNIGTAWTLISLAWNAPRGDHKEKKS